MKMWGGGRDKNITNAAEPIKELWWMWCEAKKGGGGAVKRFCVRV